MPTADRRSAHSPLCALRSDARTGSASPAERGARHVGAAATRHAGRYAELLPYAAPVFLLAVPLLSGRYVGEERLERMRSGLRRAPLRAPRAAEPRAVRRPTASLPRGGRLIAQSLAERPPPALAAS